MIETKKTEKLIDKPERLIDKPPVVVILGHVDHGKSSLIEKIKEIKITEKEVGGITQHIGAYEIEEKDKKITFIDTPGHEAFSAMRSRGTHLADIAILVVDVVEGVKDQTKEAINIAKKAQLPIIVALNKIDRKMEAQPELVKKQLSNEGILVESLGGKIPLIETSAKTGQGIEDLLETIILVAEIENLKTEIDVPAQGIVVESLLDAQRGSLATLILEKGILRQGEVLGTFSAVGKVRSIIDFQGNTMKQCFPSQPVQVLGFLQTPKIGERFKVFPDIETAKNEMKKQERLNPQVFLIRENEKVLNIILKADVLGSLEAIEQTLKNLSPVVSKESEETQQKIILRILKSEVGNIRISDIQLAETANAKIFGFRVKIDKDAEFFGKQKKIFPKIFDIIYELSEEVRNSMEKLLKPEIKRVDLGKIKIIALFKRKKDNQIIGGKVIEGEISKDSLAEIVRQEEIIGKGRIKTLEQEKKEIRLAQKGKEVGMLFVSETEVQQGDILNVFKQ